MSHDWGGIRIVLAASGMTEQECDLGLDSGVNASREIDFTAVRYSHGGGQGSDDDVGYAHLFGFGSTGEAEFDPDCALAAIFPKGNARVLDSVGVGQIEVGLLGDLWDGLPAVCCVGEFPSNLHEFGVVHSFPHFSELGHHNCTHTLVGSE
ncbi:hypothetical protein [Rhodococcus sp. SJ-2]